jgi:hypothetical protein
MAITEQFLIRSFRMETDMVFEYISQILSDSRIWRYLGLQIVKILYILSILFNVKESP